MNVDDATCPWCKMHLYRDRSRIGHVDVHTHCRPAVLQALDKPEVENMGENET